MAHYACVQVEKAATNCQQDNESEEKYFCGNEGDGGKQRTIKP
ncbi:MAG: hypothetical protein ABIJ39_11145 [Chloroflexota bacterium]